MLVPQEQLGVHSQEAGEEQSAQRGVHDLQDAVPDEDAEYGEDEEHHHAHQEHAHARGEVVAGLHGEDDHREADSCGDAHGHDDRLRVVKTGYHAHHVGQTDGQDRQGNKVPGMLSPEVPATAEDNEGDEEDGVGDIVGPDIGPDKALHLPDKSENGHSRQGYRQLQGQHQEHLSDEGLANALVPVDRGEVLVVIVGWRPFLLVVPMLR